MINNIQIPPLGKTIHLFLFVMEGEIQSWDHSIRQWVTFLQSTQTKAVVYPVPLPIQKDNSFLSQIQDSCEKWHIEFHETGICFISPDSSRLSTVLAPKNDTNPDSIIIYSPLSGVFARHSLLKNMLGKLENTHFVGGKRVAETYPFPLRTIHGLFSLIARFLFCIPIAPLCGPTTLGERLKNQLGRLLFGLRYEDVLFPVKMIRLQVLEKAWPQSVGNFFIMELAARANFLGFLFAEEESWHDSDQKIRKISLCSQPDKYWWTDLMALLKHPRFLKTPDTVEIEPKPFL